MAWTKSANLLLIVIYFYALTVFKNSHTSFEKSNMACNGTLTNNGETSLAANYCLILPGEWPKKSWNDSQRWCYDNHKASLANITSATQQEFIQSFLSNLNVRSDIWIGGKTANLGSYSNYNNWYWWSWNTSASSVKIPLRYNPLEDKDKYQDYVKCIHLNRSSDRWNWKVNYCHQEKLFLCLKLESLSSTTTTLKTSPTSTTATVATTTPTSTTVTKTTLKSTTGAKTTPKSTTWTRTTPMSTTWKTTSQLHTTSGQSISRTDNSPSVTSPEVNTFTTTTNQEALGQNSGLGQTSTIGIGIGIGVAVLLLIVLIISIVVLRRKRMEQAKPVGGNNAYVNLASPSVSNGASPSDNHIPMECMSDVTYYSDVNTKQLPTAVNNDIYSEALDVVSKCKGQTAESPCYENVVLAKPTQRTMISSEFTITDNDMYDTKRNSGFPRDIGGGNVANNDTGLYSLESEPVNETSSTETGMDVTIVDNELYQ